jgi:hypothetical protein
MAVPEARSPKRPGRKPSKNPAAHRATGYYPGDRKRVRAIQKRLHEHTSFDAAVRYAVKFAHDQIEELLASDIGQDDDEPGKVAQRNTSYYPTDIKRAAAIQKRLGTNGLDAAVRLAIRFTDEHMEESRS